MNSSENNSSESKIYSHTQKKKIANRIGNIKGKKHMKEIFRIVHMNNGSYTKDSTGVFLNINNMNLKTISTIEQYLDEKFPIVVVNPITTKFKPYCTDSTSINESSVRLTNQEKSYLRKIDSANNNLLMDSDNVITSEHIIVKPFN
jgi:hypothetical protein